MARKPSLLEQHVYSRNLVTGGAPAAIPGTVTTPFYRNVGELTGSVSALSFAAGMTIAGGPGLTVTAADILRCWTITVERYGGGAYIDNVNVSQLIPWIVLEGGRFIFLEQPAGGGSIPLDFYDLNTELAVDDRLDVVIAFVFPFRRRLGKIQSEYCCAVRQAGTEITNTFANPTDPALPAGVTLDAVRQVSIDAIIDDKIDFEAGIPWRIAVDNPGTGTTSHTMNPRYFRTIWLDTPNTADYANFAMELAGTRIPFQTKGGAGTARVYTERNEGDNSTVSALTSTLALQNTPVALPNRGDGLNRFQPQSARVEAAAAPTNAPRFVYEELQRHITAEGVPIPPNMRALRENSFARLDPRKQRQMANFAARMPVGKALPKSIVSTSWNPKSGG